MQRITEGTLGSMEEINMLSTAQLKISALESELEMYKTEYRHQRKFVFKLLNWLKEAGIQVKTDCGPCPSGFMCKLKYDGIKSIDIPALREQEQQIAQARDLLSHLIFTCEGQGINVTRKEETNKWAVSFADCTRETAEEKEEAVVVEEEDRRLQPIVQALQGCQHEFHVMEVIMPALRRIKEQKQALKCKNDKLREVLASQDSKLHLAKLASLRAIDARMEAENRLPWWSKAAGADEIRNIWAARPEDLKGKQREESSTSSAESNSGPTGKGGSSSSDGSGREGNAAPALSGNMACGQRPACKPFDPFHSYFHSYLQQFARTSEQSNSAQDSGATPEGKAKLQKMLQKLNVTVQADDGVQPQERLQMQGGSTSGPRAQFISELPPSKPAAEEDKHSPVTQMRPSPNIDTLGLQDDFEYIGFDDFVDESWEYPWEESGSDAGVRKAS
ncbi:hypothetical protein BX600DRAFT_513213 [Xylariales sp. PMI_506]|nr:hypothetical protein BX600DRAFT_513213 [Xylariales sp. PMI_506]